MSKTVIYAKFNTPVTFPGNANSAVYTRDGFKNIAVELEDGYFVIWHRKVGKGTIGFQARRVPLARVTEFSLEGDDEDRGNTAALATKRK